MQQTAASFLRPPGKYLAEILHLDLDLLVDPEHQRGDLDVEAVVRDRHHRLPARRPLAALELADVLRRDADAPRDHFLREVARVPERSDPRTEVTPQLSRARGALDHRWQA